MNGEAKVDKWVRRELVACYGTPRGWLYGAATCALFAGAAYLLGSSLWANLVAGAAADLFAAGCLAGWRYLRSARLNRRP